MSAVQSFTDLLKVCSLQDMKTMSSVLADHIAHAEKVQNDPSVLIDYVPNFIVKGQDLDNLFNEVELIMAKINQPAKQHRNGLLVIQVHTVLVGKRIMPWT